MRGQIKAADSLSRPFNINNDLRQEDAPSCVLFNLALENVIPDADINAMLFKSTQLLVYAHNIDIMGKKTRDVQSSFIQNEQAARDLGLHISEGMTNYMIATSAPKTKERTTSNSTGQTKTIKMGDYNFETIDNFSYLVSKIATDNSYDYEMAARLFNSRTYFSLKKTVSLERSHPRVKALTVQN